MTNRVTLAPLSSSGIEAEFLLRSALERIGQLEAQIRRLTWQPAQVEKFIRVFSANKIIKVPLTDVRYIQAESNYSRVFLIHGGQYCTSRTLKSWVDELEGGDFLRCHRSFLVNTKEIVEIELNTHMLIMKDGTRIPTSRRFKSHSVKAVFHDSGSASHEAASKPGCTVHKLKQAFR